MEAKINGHHTFKLRDEVVENLRPLRVVVIGAGFGGILAAIRIPEKLRNVELVVYEKNAGVGGVWWTNRYPGIACDVPSHSYQYTFAPNPNWASLYAPGSDIQKYLEGVAERYGALRYIKTSHRVDECSWDSDQNKWKIKVSRTDNEETFDDVADVLVAARGTLNNPAWPEVAGLSSFKGKIMHSSEWDATYDFEDKRIGIIGNGSSAIQIIPRLQRLRGTTIKCFMRSPTWISGSFGEVAMTDLGYDVSKIDFTEEERKLFSQDPAAYMKLRKGIEDSGNTIHESTILGSDVQQTMAEMFRKAMADKLSKKPHLASWVVPSFAPGCRRLTPGPGFLEALIEDNVEVISEPLAWVDEGGAQLASTGRHLDLDVLVCATGFHVDKAPPFQVTGRDGLSLAKRWERFPESYLSVAVDGFPNYLMVLGPNSAIGFGSLTAILEAQVEYIVKVIRKLQKEDYVAIEPKAERVADFTQFVSAYFKNTVYMDNCRSWYRSDGGRGDHVFALWPGSTLHALESLRSPRWEDFIYESGISAGENTLSWMGNGWSLTQTQGDPSWYLNEDEVDVPEENKPESRARYKARPWSY